LSDRLTAGTPPQCPATRASGACRSQRGRQAGKSRIRVRYVNGVVGCREMDNGRGAVPLEVGDVRPVRRWVPRRGSAVQRFPRPVLPDDADLPGGRFVREGTLRDCIVNGEVSDSWVFGLIRRESLPSVRPGSHWQSPPRSREGGPGLRVFIPPLGAGTVHSHTADRTGDMSGSLRAGGANLAHATCSSAVRCTQPYCLQRF
jgi:hypothetical protein